MKKFLFSISLAAVTAVYCPAQEADALFQRALLAERVQGDLESAISLYEQVIAGHPSDRTVAAQALLRMGLAQEALGTERARASYERLITEYPEQEDVVEQARVRLESLGSAHDANDDAGPAIRRIDIPRSMADAPDAAISPDGRFLATSDLETGDVAVMDLASGNIRRYGLTKSWDEAFAEGKVFSPDGKELAYLWYGADSVYTVRILNLESGEDRILVPPIEEFRGESRSFNYIWPEDWSDDGSSLLALRLLQRRRDGQDERSWTLVNIDMKSGTMSLLQAPEDELMDACFLEQGNRVAFGVRAAKGDGDIRILDLRSSEVYSFLSGPYDDTILACHRDRLIIQSNRGRSYAAYLIEDTHAADPKLEWLTVTAESLMPVGLVSDGRLFFVRENVDHAIYEADFDLTTGSLASVPRRISFDRDTKFVIGWSDDVQSFAYASWAGEIVVQHDRTVRRIRPDFAFTAWNSRVQWMPDGQSFAVATNSSRGTLRGSFIIDASTGAVRDSLSDISLIAAADDGESVFHVTKAVGDTTRCVFRRTLRDGKDETIYCGAFFGTPTFSPDNKYFAIKLPVSDRRRPPQKLVLVSTSDGSNREIDRTDGEMFFWPVFWTPDSKSLIVGTPAIEDRTETPFRRIDVTTGIANSIPLNLPGRIRRMALDSTGQRIAYSFLRQRVEDRTKLWVFEGFIGEQPAE